MFMHFRCATKQLPCKDRTGEREGGRGRVGGLLKTFTNCCESFGHFIFMLPGWLAGWLPLACCPVFLCLLPAASLFPPVPRVLQPVPCFPLPTSMLLLLVISLLPPHSCIFLYLIPISTAASLLPPAQSSAYPSPFPPSASSSKRPPISMAMWPAGRGASFAAVSQFGVDVVVGVGIGLGGAERGASGSDSSFLYLFTACSCAVTWHVRLVAVAATLIGKILWLKCCVCPHSVVIGSTHDK